jgi:D-xylose transport system substrate-binding protein
MSAIEGAVKWSGGEKGVEMNATFLKPVPVTSENLGVVIEAGWIPKDKACEGAQDTVAACK